MLTPPIGTRKRSPRKPETGYTASSSYSTPPSTSTRPAPMVSGSSVRSGRCWATALPAPSTKIRLAKSIRIFGQNCRLLSINTVTGPSLTSSTRIMAWNSPVATGSCAARNSLTTLS